MNKAFTLSRIKKLINLLNLSLIVSFCCLNLNLSAQQGREKRYVYLEGKWRFSIGDDKKWSRPDFDDHEWEEIKAPSAWEEQGFNGYDGYAWYRKHFYCPSNLSGKILYLHMGYIDDVDEVYVNGKLVGSSGEFPPYYNTAYTAYRRYPLPESLLKINGDNVISVRVYDAQMSGGIMSGELGIYAVEFPVQPDIVLEGYWKFHVDDNMQAKEKNFNDKDWNEIIVPGTWESQHYQNYDGFAWYRKKFTLPDNLKGKTLVLLLGKIDDKDETYLNGRLIGQTGNLHDEGTNDYDWQRFRGYFIPADALQKDNVIAVRVYDGYIDGGIYEGPVGIMTQEKYNAYWKSRRDQQQQNKKHQKNIWELLFGS
ncbi:MAG: beta galactosidase jelly roll domain-containing protein [Bacillota bacterium]